MAWLFLLGISSVCMIFAGLSEFVIRYRAIKKKQRMRMTEQEMLLWVNYRANRT